MVKLKLSLVLLGSILFINYANADTLYLKNGRSVEGIIKAEDQDTLELEVCAGGSIKFNKSEIQKVELSVPDEKAKMRQKWSVQKETTQAKINEQSIQAEHKPKKVEFSQGSQGIIVNALLNKKAEVSLVLDTGASFIVLKKSVAHGLGVKVDNVKPDITMTVADGRKVDAKYIVLRSVKVEGVEAENVDAAVLLDEAGDFGFKDGLLGMSFLKKFNFKVDHKENKLILEKI